MFIDEVEFQSAGLFLDAAQDVDGGTRLRHFRSGWRDLGNPLFAVGVQQIVEIQFWRVAGQIEDLDIVCVFFDRILHTFQMKGPQVVQDRENSLLPSINKRKHGKVPSGWRTIGRMMMSG